MVLGWSGPCRGTRHRPRRRGAATVQLHAEAAVTYVVAKWTGWHANVLREALRMTNEEFAEHLQVAVRTVAYWRSDPGMVPRQGMQQILDVALERAPDPARSLVPAGCSPILALSVPPVAVMACCITWPTE